LSDAVFAVPSGLPFDSEYPLRAVGAVGMPLDPASYHFRKFSSNCDIDIVQVEIGSGVSMRWRDLGDPAKNVRVRVAKHPYLSECRNQAVHA
jgi:hypothetical protein